MSTEPVAELTLRPAIVGSEDHEVASIHLAARRHAVASGWMPASVRTDAAVRCWLSDRLRSNDETWVAEVEGALVAYARFTPTWLDDCYVAPPYAGQGIGTALLDLVKASRPDGFGSWVFAANHPARRFYARHGLIEVETTDGSGNEEGAPDVRIAWPGVSVRPATIAAQGRVG